MVYDYVVGEELFTLRGTLAASSECDPTQLNP